METTDVDVDNNVKVYTEFGRAIYFSSTYLFKYLSYSLAVNMNFIYIFVNIFVCD